MRASAIISEGGGRPLLTPAQIARLKKNKRARDAWPSIATLTLHHAADWSILRRGDVARWLRRQADFVENYAPQAAARFTARYRAKD